ncbi:YjfB family protein [Lysinibacillus sp. 3P01SB]|uniref:YjfB family protein n=1 Tax=Lysinibacillus sp. 3P01SB TaxID=3132284 RepID=UPI0039A69FFD
MKKCKYMLDEYIILPINITGGATMDIAALSITMSQTQLMQNVSLAVAGKVMETQQVQVQQMTEMMESVDAPHPNLGQKIDISI